MESSIITPYNCGVFGKGEPRVAFSSGISACNLNPFKSFKKHFIKIFFLQAKYQHYSYVSDMIPMSCTSKRTLSNSSLNTFKYDMVKLSIGIL